MLECLWIKGITNCNKHILWSVCSCPWQLLFQVFKVFKLGFSAKSVEHCKIYTCSDHLYPLKSVLGVCFHDISRNKFPNKSAECAVFGTTIHKPQFSLVLMYMRLLSSCLVFGLRDCYGRSLSPSDDFFARESSRLSSYLCYVYHNLKSNFYSISVFRESWNKDLLIKTQHEIKLEMCFGLDAEVILNLLV